MNFKIALGVVAAFLMSVPVMAEDAPVKIVPSIPAAEKAQWNYNNTDWGALHEAFKACGAGLTQSPVNIRQYTQDTRLPELEIFYKEAPLEIVNNGHMVSVNYAPQNGITVGDKSYDLSHFQFHTPSEHYLDGSPYPLEIQFVHQGDDGMTVIVSVMGVIGSANPEIEKILENAPAEPGHMSVKDVTVDAFELIPDATNYYQYVGSLTTPPCTESVMWYVLKDPIKISEEQLRKFQRLFAYNARPLQGLGERVIKGQ